MLMLTLLLMWIGGCAALPNKVVYMVCSSHPPTEEKSSSVRSAIKGYKNDSIDSHKKGALLISCLGGARLRLGHYLFFENTLAMQRFVRVVFLFRTSWTTAKILLHRKAPTIGQWQVSNSYWDGCWCRLRCCVMNEQTTTSRWMERTKRSVRMWFRERHQKKSDWCSKTQLAGLARASHSTKNTDC